MYMTIIQFWVGLMTFKCHEFFGCPKVKCPMFNEKEKRNCWEVDGVLNPCIEELRSLLGVNKITYCKNCLYYKQIHRIMTEETLPTL